MVKSRCVIDCTNRLRENSGRKFCTDCWRGKKKTKQNNETQHFPAVLRKEKETPWIIIWISEYLNNCVSLRRGSSLSPRQSGRVKRGSRGCQSRKTPPETRLNDQLADQQWSASSWFFYLIVNKGQQKGFKDLLTVNRTTKSTGCGIVVGSYKDFTSDFTSSSMLSPIFLLVAGDL